MSQFCPKDIKMNAAWEIFNKGTRVKCVEGGHELEEKETRVTQSLLSNTNSLTLKPFVSKIPYRGFYSTHKMWNLKYRGWGGYILKNHISYPLTFKMKQLINETINKKKNGGIAVLIRLL